MRSLFENIGADFKANRSRCHLFVFLILYRIAHTFRSSKSSAVRTLVGIPAAIVYRAAGLFFFGIDIPARTVIGGGFAIHHGFGLVVHADSRLGSNVTVRHGVTIGALSGSDRAPVVADGVDIGAGALVIGDLTVGERAVIGAGAVVIRDVEAGGIVVGNPARVLPSA